MGTSANRAGWRRPPVADLAKSIWRRRGLILVLMALGMSLGYLVHPNALLRRAPYEASVRMDVLRSPVDGLLERAPAFNGAEVPVGVPESLPIDALKDLAVADSVARKLRNEELTGAALLANLRFRPVARTSLVDVSYTDSDPRQAADILKQYTEGFAARRNSIEKRRLNDLIRFLEGAASREQDDATRKAAAELLAQARLALNPVPLTDVVGTPVVSVSSPPLSRQATTALGLLLGLLVGIGAALLLEPLSRVVRPGDAERASGLPLIGTVRRDGVRRTPLPVVDRPFSPAAEDYRRVAASLERHGLGSDIQVLAIASPDPGDGKTMLATNLAGSLAGQGRSVVLVSSDLRRPHVEELLGIEQLPGLAETLEDDAIPAIALLVSINDHLLVLPAGRPSRHPGELLASKRLREVIHSLRQLGVVILDTPPARQSAEVIALSAVADATLLTARSGETRMRSVRETTSSMRRDRIRQLGIVLVGTSSRHSRPPSADLDPYHEQARVEPEEQRPPTLSSSPVKLTPKRIAPGPPPDPSTPEGSSGTGPSTAPGRNGGRSNGAPTTSRDRLPRQSLGG